MLANTSTAYGTVAKTFHWATALLILTLIPLGIVADRLPYDTGEQLARKAWLFSLHKTLGITVFALAVARILWALAQTKPGSIHPDRKAETFLADVVHWLLYGSLVLVPLTGWVHHAATEGFAPHWLPLPQNLPFVPESERVAGITAGLHYLFNIVLGASIVLHVTGAAKHALVDKDGTLSRMWFGITHAGDGRPHGAVVAAPMAALAIWALAVGMGTGAGLFTAQAEAAARPALAEVSSGWTVQEGTLAIEVQQLGSPVRGEFADWTAAIDFDEDSGTGSVEVVIAIASLSLGSVSDQAMGPDYFDAETHPTATFTADILPEGEAHVAEGTLTLKGTEVPVTLPFTLQIDGDTAAMEGALDLGRRDFGIGEGTDDATLGSTVPVTISLTATRDTR